MQVLSRVSTIAQPEIQIIAVAMITIPNEETTLTETPSATAAEVEEGEEGKGENMRDVTIVDPVSQRKNAAEAERKNRLEMMIST